MNTKHTPGPWSLPHFAKPDASCQCGYILSENHFGAVATVHCSGDSDDVFAHGDNPKFKQAVANARLIAAAPDLLGALERMVSGLAAAEPAKRSLFQEARAVIAKATEEQA